MGYQPILGGTTLTFNKIDRDQWNRSEHFEHYMNDAKCTYSLTANLNVTLLLNCLKDKGIKLYPAFIYMVSRVVHSYPEFRTSFDDQGDLGYWDEMIPNYTVFHQEDHTFSVIWTAYSQDFNAFQENFLKDQLWFGDQRGLWAKPRKPSNTFSISMMPWISFSSFDLHLSNDEYLLPIITGGKYFSDQNETYLPVSLRVHHAVCDGYHAGLFYNDLQALADSCEDWLI